MFRPPTDSGRKSIWKTWAVSTSTTPIQSPELQDLEVGDLVRLGPESYFALETAAIERQSALNLRGDMPKPQGKPTT